jgi:hypothetical protein
MYISDLQNILSEFIRALGPRSLKLFQGSAMRELVALGYACDLELGASWESVLEALLAA